MIQKYPVYADKVDTTRVQQSVEPDLAQPTQDQQQVTPGLQDSVNKFNQNPRSVMGMDLDTAQKTVNQASGYTNTRTRNKRIRRHRKRIRHTRTQRSNGT